MPRTIPCDPWWERKEGLQQSALSIFFFFFFFYHFYFFKPLLMLTYLTYRNQLFAFDVFRFLLKMAEELISLKVRLKCCFKTIGTIDISNMKGNLIPQFGS